MNRNHFLTALADRGVVGIDAETALDAWRRDPSSADGRRVQAVLAQMAAPAGMPGCPICGEQVEA